MSAGSTKALACEHKQATVCADIRRHEWILIRNVRIAPTSAGPLGAASAGSKTSEVEHSHALPSLSSLSPIQQAWQVTIAAGVERMQLYRSESLCPRQIDEAFMKVLRTLWPPASMVEDKGLCTELSASDWLQVISFLIAVLLWEASFLITSKNEARDQDKSREYRAAYTDKWLVDFGATQGYIALLGLLVNCFLSSHYN